MNYYNEFDPKAAAWLRELINQKHIPEGIVDERSITEILPHELTQYTQCHFFAGIGGWSLALQLAGWPADRPVWTGSCPCQPFSSAGKQLGDKDERHLWPAFFNLIRECRPDVVFGEQVASAINKGWLDGISSDLESENYACGAAVLGAHSVGGPHIRQRLYWVGDSFDPRSQRQRGSEQEPVSEGRQGTERHSAATGFWSNFDLLSFRDGKARRIESGTFPLADGVPGRVGLLRGYGNAIVPQTAQVFIEAFIG
jgi:DNA (cytosine-5)-methyltransferase 1